MNCNASKLESVVHKTNATGVRDLVDERFQQTKSLFLLLSSAAFRYQNWQLFIVTHPAAPSRKYVYLFSFLIFFFLLMKFLDAILTTWMMAALHYYDHHFYLFLSSIFITTLQRVGETFVCILPSVVICNNF